MDHGPRSSARAAQRYRFAVGAVAFAFVLGLSLIRAGTEGRPGPPRPETGAERAAPERAGAGHSAAASREGAAPPRSPPGPLPRSRPARVRVPAIGVDAPLTPVGLDAHGWLEVPPPDAENLAGWYEGAVTPGERGTAVLVGHVDDRSGPAVFFALGALKKGRAIEVVRADGRTAVFTVYAVEVHDKTGFPGERVYRDARNPELRVLTCGGDYTPRRGYRSNTVVFARLSRVR